MGNTGVVVSQNTFYQNISLLRKSLVKAGLSEDIIITVRQKALASLRIHWSFLSDEECKNMNRVTLTHYQNNKVVDFISEEKEKPDTHLNLPLIENSSKHGSDLMANKPEEGEKHLSGCMLL
nr:Uncharacterised protein [Klebsiella pneumoniae]